MECGTISRSRRTMVTWGDCCGTVESPHGQAKNLLCELHWQWCARLNCIYAHCHDDAPNPNRNCRAEWLKNCRGAPSRACCNAKIHLFFSFPLIPGIFFSFFPRSGVCRVRPSKRYAERCRYNCALHVLCHIRCWVSQSRTNLSIHFDAHTRQTERSRRTQFATGFALSA